MIAAQLTEDDVAIRLESSNAILLKSVVELSRPYPNLEHIAFVCDTETAAIDSLTDLAIHHQIAILLLLHRWNDLRARCHALSGLAAELTHKGRSGVARSAP